MRGKDSTRAASSFVQCSISPAAEMFDACFQIFDDQMFDDKMFDASWQNQSPIETFYQLS